MATYGSCIATNESFASLGMSWVNPIGPRRRGTWSIPSEYKILHPLPICFVLRFIQVQGVVGHSALRGMEGLSQIPFFLAYEPQGGLFSTSNFWMPKWKWKRYLAGILY
jgi:hypothetical protein